MGTLRFIELRFPSVTVAKRKALLLHLCTWTMKLHSSVPMLPKAEIYEATTWQKILKFWEAFDLTWRPHDRFALSQLRQRCSRYTGEVVPTCGCEEWSSASRQSWLTGDSWRGGSGGS